MKKFITLAILTFTVSSCGTYQLSVKPKVQITKVLTVTSTGDTLAVPIREFQRYNYNNVFDNYIPNFNYGFDWYSWNYPNYGWNYLYRPNSWYFRDWYYSPPIYNNIPIKPKVTIRGRRGSDNIRITPNSNNNDQIGRLNLRSYKPAESSNNGRRWRNGEDLSPKPVVPRLSNPVQPGQIRRGSRPPVLQQTRPRVNPNNEGRNGSGRIQN